jgi:hypothetical protein
MAAWRSIVAHQPSAVSGKHHQCHLENYRVSIIIISINIALRSQHGDALSWQQRADQYQWLNVGINLYVGGGVSVEGESGVSVKMARNQRRRNLGEIRQPSSVIGGMAPYGIVRARHSSLAAR